MRAVSHLFLARSRAAVFWFLVTCATIVGSGYYLQSKIADVRMLPQYVYTGSPDMYYLTPDLDIETPTKMHREQTRLAMETMFHRTPSRLDHQERLPRIFGPEATQGIIKGLIVPQAKNFHENKLHQKVQIGEIIVNIREGQGEATTVATGQLMRTGVSPENTMINETWSVKIFFEWRINPDIEERPLYPTLCNSVTFFSMERTFP
ncbi:hypothetical protein [Roseimicrobium sp. ORNL1]|uniref:hypothetical protein n=1 Tax=Roseimicrobium sp. ORNL1 TaxID=2711231 RepID=UPI0013E10C4C|nr:hypothetical protein [Roseimicrobium sp. ORNL1]QIF03864.1 hypothetical protein G5S37_20825 [Roseimicrobium sp. ORNL1]